MDTPKSYAAEVVADPSGAWSGNALRFKTPGDARAYVDDLAWRWTLVRDTRVVPTQDEPTDAWDPALGAVRL